MKANITAEILTITPELASEWLADRWGEQRQVRTRHVQRMVADMHAGNWRVSPDAVLRVKGKLANGQHRLEAVCQSGQAQQFLVMHSNDEELYKVIDAGLRRTASDGLVGMPYAQRVTSIARWVIAYEQEKIMGSANSGAANFNKASCGFITQSQMIDYCLGCQDILTEAAHFVVGIYEETKLLTISVGGALYVIGNNHGKPEETRAFLREVYNGGPASAAADLRNRLIANRGAKAKLNQGYVFALCLKALKAYLEGRRVACLRFAKDETFPSL